MARILKNIKREKQKFAYKQVKDIKENDNIKNKDYKSLVEKLGMMIYTNGLISTMAHLKAKKGVHKELYKHISAWFKRKELQIPFRMDKRDDLLQKLLYLDNSRMMMLLTKEAIHLSDAFKEMVKVMLKDTENETD